MKKDDRSKTVNINLQYILGIILIIFIAVSLVFPKSRVRDELSYEEYISAISDTSVEKNIIVGQNANTPTGSIRIFSEDSSFKYDVYYVSDVTKEIEFLKSKNIDFKVLNVESNISYLPYIQIVLTIAVLILFMRFLFGMRRTIENGHFDGMENGPFESSRSPKSNMTNTSEYRFSHVAGLSEEREELEEIVDFLKAPQKYSDMGARIPKGVILVGPPGTGKTLLGKAIAGEAGVPFFSIAGSEFVELYVGVGAARVRSLFKEAKQNAPCIVFIDEIDAVARRRGAGLGGGHDEREQTLNQLLVQMDGFEKNSGVIVLAATNRVDILDPAILRPGRFDRKIYVGLPDVKAREDIFKVHASNKKLSDDINFGDYAKVTVGFSGADIENMMNEAAILAAKENSAYINDNILNRSLIKISVGKEKKSRIVNPDDRRITAYHEAGHAILVRECSTAGKINVISIIPTGNSAAGYTLSTPEDEEHYTKKMMLEEIMVLLAGRTAEEIALDDITAGAVSDIQRATKVARNMVVRFGMSEKLGIIDYSQSDDEVMLGRDFGHTKNFSEETAKFIDEEVKRIIDECHKKTADIINSHRDVLDRCANLLLEKEKIGYDEFESLFV